MWVVRDTAIGKSPVISTNGDTLYYKNIYCVYRISPENGSILDSIRFGDSGGGTYDFLWGIAYHKSNIYVSYNGGWGACTYKLYPMNKDSLDQLIGAHPSGMTVIGDERWEVGAGMVFNGNSLATLGENGSETFVYQHLFDVADITFDGQHIWLCDNKKSSLCKMEKITTAVTSQPVFMIEDLSVYRHNDRVIITHPLLDASFNLSVYTMQGKKLNSFTYKNGIHLIWPTGAVSNGIYLLNISNGTEQYRQRVFINK